MCARNADRVPWATPVQFVLLLFGLANAGVPFEQVGPGTYFVVAALLLGKPFGILLFSGAARLVGPRAYQRACQFATWSWWASPQRSASRSRGPTRLGSHLLQTDRRVVRSS